MSRDRHPAQRHLTVVQDAASTAAWWEAERAAARRDIAAVDRRHAELVVDQLPAPWDEGYRVRSAL